LWNGRLNVIRSTRRRESRPISVGPAGNNPCSGAAFPADHFSGIRFDRHRDLIAEMIENKRRRKHSGISPSGNSPLDSAWGCTARAPNLAELCHRFFERHDDFVSLLDGGNQVECARARCGEK
jgi:hypothetical protein